MSSKGIGKKAKVERFHLGSEQAVSCIIGILGRRNRNFKEELKLSGVALVCEDT